MFSKFSVIFTCFYCLIIVSASELDYDGWMQIKLYHSFDINEEISEFTERGSITISSVKSGSANVVQKPLTDAQIIKLQNLAEEGGKYRLSAAVKTSSGYEVRLLTSILACHLLGSNLDDTLYIWVDISAEPIAVNLIPQGPCTTEKPFVKSWNTNVQVKYPESGPVPDTASYVQKLERERQARESGEGKDNRSFFAKYWMYIVPAVIFFALTSATNPDAHAGGR